jgi:hypothetical protein
MSRFFAVFLGNLSFFDSLRRRENLVPEESKIGENGSAIYGT